MASLIQPNENAAAQSYREAGTASLRNEPATARMVTIFGNAETRSEMDRLCRRFETETNLSRDDIIYATTYTALNKDF